MGTHGVLWGLKLNSFFRIKSSASGGFAPDPHRGFAPGPHWGTSVPQTRVIFAPPEKFSGYATGSLSGSGAESGLNRPLKLRSRQTLPYR